VNQRILAIVAVGLFASPAWAQSQNASGGPPDRFQIDVGYFNLEATTLLRYGGPKGSSGEVSFEQDLGQDPKVDTYWIDGSWRVGRRHQLKLSYTQLSRERKDKTLTRDFIWGGQNYTAGLNATSTSGSDILGGYYRFAAVRNDKFEIGPTVGLGYLSLEAGIQATGTAGGQSRSFDVSKSSGSPTGALGAYAVLTPVRKLALHGDFLYISANLANTEVSVTDWRLAAHYYFFRSAGVGLQYKYYKYTLDRTLLASEIAGEIEFQGVQAFLTFRF